MFEQGAMADRMQSIQELRERCEDPFSDIYFDAVRWNMDVAEYWARYPPVWTPVPAEDETPETAAAVELFLV